METRTIIQTIGAIAKEEILTSLDSSILEGTLVLENSEPFPGYHGTNIPENKGPLYIFLVTPEKYSNEKIIRVAHKIHQKYPEHFDASSGKICIETINYYCIRLRGLARYNQVETLQSWFLKEGINFSRKKKIHSPGIIQLRKHFNIEEVVPGIYLDLEDAQMHYLQIPAQIRWEPFKKVTSIVKNNVENNNFDAALGAFYLRDVTDVIRIYSNKWEIGALMKLRERFVSEIARFES